MTFFTVVTRSAVVETVSPVLLGCTTEPPTKDVISTSSTYRVDRSKDELLTVIDTEGDDLYDLVVLRVSLPSRLLCSGRESRGRGVCVAGRRGEGKVGERKRPSPPIDEFSRCRGLFAHF